MSRNGWGKLGRDTIAYVLGDYMTDVYQNVRVTKIAPDAPAPVWELEGEPVEVPGGAGNVAAQFLHLAGDVTLASLSAIAGTNTTIRNHGRLRTLSRAGAVSRKTRFVSNGHVHARLDSPKPKLDYTTITLRVRELLQEIDDELRRLEVNRGKTRDGKNVVAVLSDYAAGFWTGGTAIRAVSMFCYYGVPVVVDAKPSGVTLPNWHGATVVKLNEPEAFQFSGGSLTLESAGQEVRRLLHCPVVVTRAGQSPIIFESGTATAGFGDYTTDRPLWASGAGDCFAAYLAAGYAGTETHKRFTVPREAVELAHAAGAVYVTKKHNTAVHPREAAERLSPSGAKLYSDPAELSSRLSALPTGAKIGYTNGCFDLFHAGHAALLEYARKQCDFLCVFVNSDESIYDLKGTYPTMSFAERVAVLSAVGSVGAVIGYNENTPRAIFEKVGRCDVLVKGADYEGHTLAGHEFAERCAIAPEVFAVHSSDIAKRIRVSGRGV